MCGFCGFTSNKSEQREIIQAMMNKIVHRGPDSEGVFQSEGCTLGFRRLSIIDLDEGTQPMFNEDESLVVVFNGEIYNYQELRESLLKKGHLFRNKADTEVLLHLYEEYGENMLQHLRGMFAFVIYNKKDNSVFAARDFFGIKPFYYALIDQQLVFASEIKSILAYTENVKTSFQRKVNKRALENYLTFQYSVFEETFFEGIYKLLPSHCLHFKDKKLSIKKYWEISFEEDRSLSLESAVSQIEAVVKNSIKAHKISDVEVGSFLSSGVDSSFVAACFNGDKTFTVGFDYDQYNEIGYAKDLSEIIKIKNHSKTITTEEYWDVLPNVQYQMDEPLADPSAVALYFVSQMASQHVKVALSGEGADEFFGGYNIYKEPLDLRPLSVLPMPLRKLMGFLAGSIPFSVKGKNFFIRGSKTVEERFIGNANIFSQKEREDLLKEAPRRVSPKELLKPLYDKVKNYDDITKMQYIDLHTWLIGDILLKADKMSMAHSLEVRVPYLDKEVFSVARRLPTALRVNKSATKLAFRLAAKKNLPEAVANKKKLGFPVPIRLWLREEKYYKQVKKAFSGSVAQEFFHTEKLVRLLDLHKAGKKDNSRKIWTVYAFLLWHSMFFDTDL